MSFTADFLICPASPRSFDFAQDDTFFSLMTAFYFCLARYFLLMKFASANFHLYVSHSEIYRIGEADISPPSADGAIHELYPIAFFIPMHKQNYQP